jgi:hypothetical protein
MQKEKTVLASGFFIGLLTLLGTAQKESAFLPEMPPGFVSSILGEF